MMLLNQVLNVLVSPRRIPVRVLIITALASVVLLMGAIIQGQPLYIMAFFVLLPWLPIFLFESIWKIEHYSWVAIFGILVVLHLGHLGEHITQVAQLSQFEGTPACPPPVDNALHAERAVAAGRRSPAQVPTGISSSWVVKPDKATGLPAVAAGGSQVIGPAACGVFGQLDLEIVHLVWELMGWLSLLLLLVKFPRNIWLWIGLAVVSIHTVEHLFISWLFFVETEALYTGAKQLWGTTVAGKIVTAHPVGLEPALLTFYEAAGKNGILGQGGLVDALLDTPVSFLLNRPQLHFWYNLLVFMPMFMAFLEQARRVYDEYLARALPELSEEQLIWATPRLASERYGAGSTIVAEGQPADRFYIITKGMVKVLQKQADGTEVVVNRLGAGQYFGEISLIQPSTWTATVQAMTTVELICLDHKDFANLVSDSDHSRTKFKHLIEQRLGRVVFDQELTTYTSFPN